MLPRISLSRASARGSLALLLLTAVSGCKLGPNFSRPETKVEDAWKIEGNDRLVGEPIAETDWWKSFEDPVLLALVEEAFSSNRDLHAAAARVVQARVGRTAAYELLFPAATAGASATHSFLGRNVRPEVDVTIPDVTVNVPPGPGLLPPLLEVSGTPSVKITPELDLFSGGFDAIWELDLWGEKRRGVEASKANLEAAYASYDSVMVSLAGEVAATYIRIRTIDARLETLGRNIESMKAFQATADERVAKGESPETDKHLAATLVAIVEVGAPALRDERRRAMNSLGVLLGRTPGDVAEIVENSDAIPSVPARLALGVPADLLRRRPDVRMAEHLAHAQCAKIGKAKAAILPSFKLLGSLGLSSSNLDNLFESKSVAATYGAAVSVNGLLLYPFTVLRIRLEDARFEEAMARYEQSVLAAARDAEDAISGFFASQEAIPILDDGSAAATRSAELAVQAYGAGKVIVSVPLVALTFQAQLQDQAIAARGRTATSAVAIYKSLGGGWESRQGDELVPEEMRERMKNRTDWRTFTGKIDLRTERAPAK